MKFFTLIFCSLVIPFALLGYLEDYVPAILLNTVITAFVCSALYGFSLRKLNKYPGENRKLMLLPNLLVWYGIAFLILYVLRIPHSNTYLGTHLLTLVIGSLVLIYLRRKEPLPKIHFIPISRAKALPQINNVEWIVLDKPDENIQDIETLVADLHSPKLTDEWQHFIAQKTLQGVDVYNVRQIQEALTGRLRIRHMYENDLGSLQPSDTYLRIKQILDIILVIASFPITLPVMLITAIAIKLESEGNILFIQNRVGQNGKEFKIYKFRSMCKDSEKNGAQFAQSRDMRVTRIGKFIRKTRIDELPQFFNILKGDMALIGPRPEQKAFVEQFEKNIPFYNYRHIVKPGITGWAQVTHGYAATEDETQVKVEHDFFYIKHFSFSLDVLIFFKTIHTMLTGFGAR